MTTGHALINEIDGLRLEPGSLAFWWLGQLGYAVKIQDTVFYIDPFLTPGKFRNVPPLLDPSDITNADWVLGTHDHGDHIDTRSLPGIMHGSFVRASPDLTFSRWASRQSVLLAWTKAWSFRRTRRQ
jgi:L-ascorbate metabolism protein UlaG (beta-lactamase superfamily)